MNKGGVSYNEIKSVVPYERFVGESILGTPPSKALSLSLFTHSYLLFNIRPDSTLFPSSVSPSLGAVYPNFLWVHVCSTHVPCVRHPTLFIGFYSRLSSVRANSPCILMAGGTHGRHESCLNKKKVMEAIL